VSLPEFNDVFVVIFEANGNWDKALEVAKTKDLPGGRSCGKGEAHYQL